MSLRHEAENDLNQIGAFQNGIRPLEVAHAGQRLSSTLTAVDSLACAFEQFLLTSDALSAAPIDQLRGVAENLSRRLTYLLEPISPIEVDADQCLVQLRSSPPQKADDGTSYYELLVRRGGQLSLCRYLQEPAQPRRRIAAHVTREVFLRLVADFAAAAV